MQSWQVTGASVCGRSHEQRELPCQDAHGWACEGTLSIVGVVADGAGSASQSALGAKTAIEAALAACKDLPATHSSDGQWQQTLGSVFRAAHDAVVEVANQENLPIRELASTLLVFVARPDGIVANQIGDGAVIGSDASGKLFSVTTPQCGEYINETMFLVTPGALERTQFGVWRGSVSQVAAFTDGLQMLALKLADGSPHAPFFDPLFRFLAQHDEPARADTELASFLRSERIRKRSDDDITLLIASLREVRHALG